MRMKSIGLIAPLETACGSSLVWRCMSCEPGLAEWARECVGASCRRLLAKDVPDRPRHFNSHRRGQHSCPLVPPFSIDRPWRPYLNRGPAGLARCCISTTRSGHATQPPRPPKLEDSSPADPGTSSAFAFAADCGRV
jgi:hypothetical protein